MTRARGSAGARLRYRLEVHSASVGVLYTAYSNEFTVDPESVELNGCNG